MFLTTLISFFLAEMGDKTQLATVALGANYSSIWYVTIGSTVGMMGSNALAIFLGDALLKKIPMKFVRMGASFLFLIFGLGIIFGD
nr:TMEM165/GDT1 family protein [Pseudomonas nitroreducens]